MNVLSKVMSWLRPTASPEDLEAERRGEQKRGPDAPARHTSNAGPAGIYAPVLEPDDAEFPDE
jgi:hypothetical protein